MRMSCFILRQTCFSLSQEGVTTLEMKLQPEAVNPAKLHELAHGVIQNAKFPMLATVDPSGQPRVRPVSPVRVDDDFTVYIANLKSYQKTHEISVNPKVELAYLDSSHDQVRISGEVRRVSDGALIEEIWKKNPLLTHYLGSPENPEFILYQVIAQSVRFMKEWSLEYFEVPIR